jgi:hypothetical protein
MNRRPTDGGPARFNPLPTRIPFHFLTLTAVFLPLFSDKTDSASRAVSSAFASHGGATTTRAADTLRVRVTPPYVPRSQALRAVHTLGPWQMPSCQCAATGSGFRAAAAAVLLVVRASG